MIVRTAHGAVEGFREGGLWKFLGIPYGKAERFGVPQACDWDGIRRGDRFGKKAMQRWRGTDGEASEKKRAEMGEDCLNLNIYVPVGSIELAGEDGRSGLPVAVYIHGGAFQNGSNRERNGERVIGRHRFLFVSINYRLGALGYLYLGNVLGEQYQHSGNNGTQDQLLALKWIYENIGAFGGDRDRITVFGESAGAKALGALMLRPELQKWCCGAMLASGGYQCIREEGTASRITELFYEEAQKQGILQQERDILTMDVDRLLEIQERIVDNPGNTCMFGPVADGAVIPYDWKERIGRGEYWSGNAVVGSCLHEMVFLRRMYPDLPSKAEEIAACLFGKNGKIALQEFSEYEEAVREQGGKLSREEASDKWVQIFSDHMYRSYSHRLARLLTDAGSRVWHYSFEYGIAAHVQDQSMAFDGAAEQDLLFPGISLEKRERMAEVLHETYARFLETGSPEWEGIPEWKPLCVKNDRMLWKEKPEIGDFGEEEVSGRFPASVYRL